MTTIEILNHTIDYWYEEDQEMPDHEEDHVREMIIEGYSSGQLIDVNHETGNENTGWWKIICPYCEARKEVIK